VVSSGPAHTFYTHTPSPLLLRSPVSCSKRGEQARADEDMASAAACGNPLARIISSKSGNPYATLCGQTVSFMLEQASSGDGGPL
jgi:hypothetical protein